MGSESGGTKISQIAISSKPVNGLRSNGDATMGKIILGGRNPRKWTFQDVSLTPLVSSCLVRSEVGKVTA